MLWKASVFGALCLLLGRVFGAGREFVLAREVGPTDEMASYVLASTIFLALAGLVAGVASALVLRGAGSLRNIGYLAAVLGALPILGLVLCDAVYRLEHFQIFFLFAISIPFYAVYGVANGRLLCGGLSSFGMLTSTIPALVSAIAIFVPMGMLVDRAAWGNLLGAVVMAALTRHRSRLAEIPDVTKSAGVLVVQATAISAVSVINIASPIIDRFFATGFGSQELVLLNLGAILYVGATTSLGLAMGNAAVSRESIGAPSFSVLSMVLVPLLVCVAFMLLIPVFVTVVLSGASYGMTAPALLTGICFIYALTTPCAIINQINMRLWNRTAEARSMFIFAAAILILNLLCNMLFVSVVGVIGIAVATFTVQILQTVVLGIIRSDSKLSTLSISGTVFLGGLVVVFS
ncbi:hypothetical protein QFZ70_000742 [Arthrobacter sp. V1I9]|uniref:hypothetical protein n=1 Tax=Arthrobacter sp. V1I9 TaxID=3042275 RepID=UPI00279019A2|nr:hypothetical protein [Arthrobacter sp. V1I9]MDQ0868269.1 hypothetical protein [Arthrobacter sp. V1I9]